MAKKIKDDYEYFQIITPEGIKDIEQNILPKVEEKPKEKEKVIKKKSLYYYSGSVRRFNKIVIDQFEATTMAVSIRKAEQNIIYKAKMKLGLAPNAGGITLSSKLVEEAKVRELRK